MHQIVPPSNMIGGHGGGVVSATFGIVELEDGSVIECYPNEVKFLDRKHEEFYFQDSQS